MTNAQNNECQPATCSTETNRLVEQYREKHDLYSVFTSRVKALLEDLLDARDIKSHPLEARVKDIDSLAEKVCRPGKQYGKSLTNLPDLSGLRIILTYFDDVPKVCDLIREELDVFEEESDDKAERLDPNEFDYLSVHFVVKIKEDREILTEWKRFAGLKAEIQVRTVLQHAWANVSHDLYKNKNDVPPSLRRRLNRLSGMFELADEEFLAIKTQIGVLAEQSDNKIKQGNYENVELTSSSLDQYIDAMSTADHFSSYANELGWDLITFCHDSVDEDFADLAGVCEMVDINTISEFDSFIDEMKHEDRYKQLLKELGTGGWCVSPLFIIQLLVLLDRGAGVKHETLMSTVNWDGPTAQDVLEIARKQAS